MLDSTLRPVKERLLAPLARSPLGRVPPLVLSIAGLVASLAAATAAWRGAVVASVLLWLLGRLLDGLDGLVARATSRQSDLGGLVDFLFDAIGYAAVPIGIAFAVDDRATWIATAVVLAAFYVNAVSLGQVAATLEKRAIGAAHRDEPTSTTLPRGLVEGTETIVFFTVALAWPSAADIVWLVMAAAVGVTVVERLRWTIGVLRHDDTGASSRAARTQPVDQERVR